VPKSRVIVLRNIADIQKDLIDESAFCEFFSDVRDECERYGKVLCVKIPRPRQKRELTAQEEAEERERKRQEDEKKLENKEKRQESGQKEVEIPEEWKVPGIGSVFVEFTSLQEAVAARKYIHTKKFGGKLVEVGFHDEKAFERNYLERPAVTKAEEIAENF